MSDDDYKIEYSSLCQNFSEGSVTVQVQIYRGEDDPGWILEVVDQEGASTVWDNRFATDEAAFVEFIKAVRSEGLTGVIQPHPSGSFH
jgi:RPA family protein